MTGSTTSAWPSVESGCSGAVSDFNRLAAEIISNPCSSWKVLKQDFEHRPGDFGHWRQTYLVSLFLPCCEQILHLAWGLSSFGVPGFLTCRWISSWWTVVDDAITTGSSRQWWLNVVVVVALRLL